MSYEKCVFCFSGCDDCDGHGYIKEVAFSALFKPKEFKVKTSKEGRAIRRKTMDKVVTIVLKSEKQKRTKKC